MIKRRRPKPESTLQERLSAWSKEMREQAEKLPPGRERDDLLKRARQAEIADHLTDWAGSPGLQPPK